MISTKQFNNLKFSFVKLVTREDITDSSYKANRIITKRDIINAIFNYSKVCHSFILVIHLNQVKIIFRSNIPEGLYDYLNERIGAGILLTLHSGTVDFSKLMHDFSKQNNKGDYQEEDKLPKQEPTQRVEEPPIGVMPRRIHKEHRFYDLCGAITRYYNANYPIPTEWIEEYIELLRELI